MIYRLTSARECDILYAIPLYWNDDGANHDGAGSGSIVAGKAEKEHGEAGGRARGIDRLIQILEYLHEDGRPQRPNDIAAGIGAPKSSVYEIVNRLVAANFLEPFDREGRLFLGRKLHFLGAHYLETFDLLREADPTVAALSAETRETAQLCMCEGDKYVVALAHSGGRHFKISSDIGRPIPLTWTASGRLLVADRSENEIIDFIPPEDFTLPDGKPLATRKFLSQVESARAEGFYSSDSVVDDYTHCFAAPVRDRDGACLATLCIVAPREEAKRRHGELRDSLLRHAATLTAKLGGGAKRRS